MEISYCDSTTDREELHLPEKVPGMEYACEEDGSKYSNSIYEPVK